MERDCRKARSVFIVGSFGCCPFEGRIQAVAGSRTARFAGQVVSRIEAGKTILRLPLRKEEQLYGFGLNFQTVHQRGKILNLHVDHYGGKDTGRTHAPVPFYVSSAGYGVFINSARYLTVYAGSAARKDSPEKPVAKDRNTDKSWSSQQYSDAVEILIPAEGVEVYLFAGPTPLDAIRRYNLLCGRRDIAAPLGTGIYATDTETV